MWSTAISRQQLQQSISRLGELNEVPALPKEHAIIHETHSTRRMRTERECEIASNLAFLSATSDDSAKVMAVCVEEHPDGEGATIRLSSNSGDLSEVTNGFRLLANILEQAARRENPKPENIQAFFRQVIVLDFHRILSRLRSRHAKRSIKTAGKPAVLIQLNQIISDASIKARPGFTKKNLKALRDRARKLQILFTSLEDVSDTSANAFKMQEIVREIVEDAHEFTIAGNLTTALESFSGNPSIKSHLPEAIGKLGRYYSASIELVCAARDRECRIFQHIQVMPFQIKKPADPQETSGRVHAEIQLLFFYELHPHRLRPRFICSSKSACYMCNLFFLLHGGFNVPRTHGRLYHKWLLPDWLDVPAERRRGLGIVLTRLKATLDTEIQRTSKSKKKYNYPNESVLPLLAHWPSTSALSPSRLSTPLSTSTIRPRSSLIQEGTPHNKLLQSTEMPSNLPRIPPEPHHSSHRGEEPAIALGSASLPETSREGVGVLAPDSVITIRHHELPYSKSITGTTPSLHLRLDRLHLTVEFVQVFSGHLLIQQAEEAAVWSKGDEIVDIMDLPTATELRLNCSHSSNELSVQLQNDQKGIIRFTFVWDKAATHTNGRGN